MENADAVDSMRAAVTKQGGVVRQMKKDGAGQQEITAEVTKLKTMKAELDALLAAGPQEEVFNRAAMDDLLKQRAFIIPSFEIYGSVAGFFDFGPPACALKGNFINMWKQHFVLQESMLEIDCTNLMADIVLKTSGHVERFTDLMVKDTKNGECFRADKLLEDHIDDVLAKSPAMPTAERQELLRVQVQAESYTPEQLGEIIEKMGIKSPSSGAELTAPFPFNLMFQTQIGPSGNSVGYLRPETAQGIFVNFRRLLEYNSGKLPFAAAQIGIGFRNEIAPRAGLLRVREFPMAEIEHFVNPADKSHPKFKTVADQELPLFPCQNQLGDGKLVFMKAGEAVEKGLISNETLAYFLCRTALFADRIGLNKDKLRFRQHLPTEMAHYATDCWDLEVNLSYGWTECVGHADRACYDLEVHAKKSKVNMQASQKFDVPRDMDFAVIKANKGMMGKVFKKEASKVHEHFEKLSVEDAMAIEEKLAADGTFDLTTADGTAFALTREMVSWKKTTKKVSEVKFMPGVIEPSFGIGRLIYAIFEHSFYLRENDEKRGVMGFSNAVAPVKVAVLPLQSNASFTPLVDELAGSLLDAGISSKVDSSGVSIGRRYARMDEIGVPFAVTIDFDTVAEPNRPCTIRERDSTAQVSMPFGDVLATVQQLLAGASSWADLVAKYGLVAADASTAAEPPAAPK
jgi:glycyl-tRNA synthetase